MLNNIVFISHSSKTRAALTGPIAIAAALRQKGYDVFLDEETIKGGSEWRPEILTHLGQCSAAVLVLTKAALKSAWVKFEASILAYRKAVRHDFTILTIVVPPTKKAALSSREFAPLSLDDFQCLQGEPGKLAQDIVNLMGGAPAQPSTDEEDLADKIFSDLLSGRNYAQLNSARQRLNIPCPPWKPGEHLCEQLGRALARFIVDAGVTNFDKAITALGRESLSNDAWSKLVTLIVAFWARHEAAQALKTAALSSPPQAVALNGECLPQFTSLAHVHRAFWNETERVTPIPIDWQAGVHLGPHVSRQIKRWVERRRIDTTRTKLRCVVTLPDPLVKPQTLRALRNEFPWVLFVAGCGRASPEEAAKGRADLVPLRPAVDLEDERRAFSAYMDVNEMLFRKER